MKEASNTMSIVPTKDFSATKVVDMIKTGKYKFCTLHHHCKQQGKESSQAKKEPRSDTTNQALYRSAVTKMSTHIIYDQEYMIIVRSSTAESFPSV